MESVLLLFGGLSLLLWIYLVFLHGRFWRPDQQLYSDGAAPERWPNVAVVIVTCNDAEAIEETLPSVLNQMYPGLFHVILVDDNSRDRTVEAALRVVDHTEAGERFSVLASKPVPNGWSRRSWALAQAEEFVVTMPGVCYLWITEPWVLHGSQNLHDLVAKAEQDRCRLVSLIPRSTCESLWDRVLSPAFAFLFRAFHPLPEVNDSRCEAAVACPGCTLLEIRSLMQIGGFAAFKDAPVLETQLAENLKEATPSGEGISVNLGDYSTLVRPGDEWKALSNLARSTADAQLRKSRTRLAAGIVAIALACLVPPVVMTWALAAGLFLDIDQFLKTFLAILAAAIAWTGMCCTAWPTFQLYEQDVWVTFTLPLAVLAHVLLTLAAVPPLSRAIRRAEKNAVEVSHTGRQRLARFENDHPSAAHARADIPAPGHAFRQRIERS